MSTRNSPSPAALQALACLALVVQPGCMSALTSAGLREAVFDTIDSLAASAAGDAPAPAADADVSARVATDAADAGADDAAEPAVEPARVLSLDEAVERAVNRLNGRGRLDAETQATLLAILDATSPEDWPAAIDAFTASLESRRMDQRSAGGAARREVAAREPPGKLVVVEVSRPVPPVSASEPAVAPENLPAPESPAAPVAAALGAEEPLADAVPVIEPAPAAPAPVEPPPLLPPPSLAIRNPCFVTRVRGWGDVDRFSAAEFRPGQDVIVYFELDAPASRRTDAGHATSVDAAFRLVAADGRQVGQWVFEPIDQTSHAPRRDYFARYFLRIPETASPGACRLEFAVSDRVAGASTQAHLDLEVR